MDYNYLYKMKHEIPTYESLYDLMDVDTPRPLEENKLQSLIKNYFVQVNPTIQSDSDISQSNAVLLYITSNSK